MNGADHGFKYKGYEYQPYEDIEEDNRKIFHDVITPSGETIHIDFSPYHDPTLDEFKLWVDIGCPTRKGLKIGYNFDGKYLLKLATERRKVNNPVLAPYWAALESGKQPPLVPPITVLPEPLPVKKVSPSGTFVDESGRVFEYSVDGTEPDDVEITEAHYTDSGEVVPDGVLEGLHESMIENMTEAWWERERAKGEALYDAHKHGDSS